MLKIDHRPDAIADFLVRYLPLFRSFFRSLKMMNELLEFAPAFGRCSFGRPPYILPFSLQESKLSCSKPVKMQFILKNLQGWIASFNCQSAAAFSRRIE